MVLLVVWVVSVTVPAKPWMLIIVIFELAFIPCWMKIDDGVEVSRKLPVGRCASVTVKFRRVPLTLTEPSEKIVNRSRALSGAFLVDIGVEHSSLLNPLCTF